MIFGFLITFDGSIWFGDFNGVHRYDGKTVVLYKLCQPYYRTRHEAQQGNKPAQIVGAGKTSLFLQFLSESMLTFLIALVLATGLIYGIMPMYNDIAGKNIVFKPWSPDVLMVYGLALLITLLLAGIYPAITLSSFKPLEAMKGKLSGIGSKGGFRKVLVVVQFSFSIMLIASTLIIGKQLKYIREKNLGYDKENVFSFWMRNIDSHSYRTDLSWWVFALAGAITLLVAMITVSFKCIQAALANPVSSLRAE